MTDVYVIGDLHGHYDDYVRLLRDARLVDDRLDWSGGSAHLWQIGDFFDRGPQGADCVSLTMKLQQQAAQTGGEVHALLGNHELMLICVGKFGDARFHGGVSVRNQWYRWGGKAEDLVALSPAQLDWICHLPSMVRLGDRLLVHADSIRYLDHGTSIEAVNRSFLELMESTDLLRWEVALSGLCEHEAFSQLEVSGQRKAEMMLHCFGGAILVHGHTPIAIAAGRPPKEVVAPWVYAGGSCINVDGGLYLGGSGFVYRFQMD